ncbi:hypothetical protein ACI1SN_002736, partial [Staphylococcus aureus]
CQKFLSTIKKAIIPYVPRITAINLKSSYFYIVSRQEETRFQLVSKTFQKPSIHKNQYHANDTQNTRLQLKNTLE